MRQKMEEGRDHQEEVGEGPLVFRLGRLHIRSGDNTEGTRSRDVGGEKGTAKLNYINEP